MDWKEIVKYIAKHSNPIRKTTRPLREHFGIHYFTYHRIDQEGKYTVLVDRPDWAEHYVSEEIYLQDPYLRNMEVYESGMCLLGSHGSKEYRETVLKAGKEVLGMDTALMLVQKTEKCVEFYGFSGNRETSCLENLYLNHPHLLHSFAIHFKKELQSLLMPLEEASSSLLKLKGKDFLCGQPISPDIGQASRTAFLADLGMKKELELAAKLSYRERQCLKLLIQGKSAKESAAHLLLSRRTIEFYLENIKNKLGCWSKQELVATATKLNLLRLL